jgi:Fe-S protein assembly co-chaperone HscB
MGGHLAPARIQVDEPSGKDQLWLWAFVLHMNAFATFGISPVFRLDKGLLDRVYREKSKLGQSYEVTSAYQTLKDPVRRAEAVFDSFGTAIGDEHEPKPTHAFLLEVLEAREQLSEQRLSGDIIGIETLAAKTESSFDALLSELDGKLAKRRTSTAADLNPLLPRLGELRYLAKLLAEANESLDAS